MKVEDRDVEVADDIEVIRGNSAGHSGISYKAVIGSVHKPVEDMSFFIGGLEYRLGQLELEEIHCSSCGGVLGTVIEDIEVTKDAALM